MIEQEQIEKEINLIKETTYIQEITKLEYNINLNKKELSSIESRLTILNKRKFELQTINDNSSIDLNTYKVKLNDLFSNSKNK